jgi:hypothetical protein
MGELLKFVLEGSFELGNTHSKLVVASHYLPAIPKSNVIWNAVFPAGTVCETIFWNAENTHIDLECRV